MADSICIFEDDQYPNLLPLAYVRPVYDLRCGILSLREKIRRAYRGSTIILHTRRSLADLVKLQNPGVPVNARVQGTCLFINGRVLAEPRMAKKIPLKGTEAAYMSGDTLVAARVTAATIGEWGDTFGVAQVAGLPRVDIEVKTVRYPWDLVHSNRDQIVQDFKELAGTTGARMKGKVYAGATLLKRREIVVGAGAVVKPGAVLDAEGGPIYVGAGATILPNVTIEGPVSIGARTVIKAGARIYENTTIGEMCKVGGEVEASIIHSYSNKQHDGFLGHSYLGMWVNLGADTNTSDLKNNYGNVKVELNGALIDTGRQFVGLTMGDHSKAGINTMFNTGTVVGISSNIFGAGFPPKSIPSFAWGGSEGLATYDLEKSLEVARCVMARRNIELSAEEEKVLREAYAQTAPERAKLGS